MMGLSIDTAGPCWGGMCRTPWGRCSPMPRQQGWGWQRGHLRPQQHGTSDTQSKRFHWSWRVYSEMINSLFADLLQELEGAENWIVGCCEGLFL